MRYRKKPVEVEAFQLNTEEDGFKIYEWIGNPNNAFGLDHQNRPWMKIETLEGKMKADCGDFIIKGVKGEFYPCKPDIFAETYEIVK